MRTHFSLFSLGYQNRHTNIGITYSKKITPNAITTNTATTTSKVNKNLGSGPLIQIVGQDYKYKYKLSKQGWYMQTQVPDW